MDIAAKTTECLDLANACHDADPPRGASLLRQIDPDALNPGQRPLYGFLLNHVLTEKLGQPAEAWERQQTLLKISGAEAPLPLLRHAAAAARLVGDAAAEAGLCQRVATLARVDLSQANELNALAATSFEVPGLAGPVAGQRTLDGLAALRSSPAWQQSSGLDAAVAVLTNNIASDLAGRPPAELSDATLRAAATQAAEWSQVFWHRAGQWIHHARAHYLRALVANSLGDAPTAETQAQAGLVLLTSFDKERHERADEAFLRLQLAHALARLGRPADAQVERTLADGLIEALDDADVSADYRHCVARQQQLDSALAAA